MKKFFLITALALLFLGNCKETAVAQTPGTLTFSVTTTEPAGGYTNVNVIALWIEDTNGNFIKTKIRYAGTRIQYLNQWVSSSSYDVTDAVTGATRTSHGTLFFNWNGTDVNGNVVTDNYYRVYLQMSDANTVGQWTYVQFNKDSLGGTVTAHDTMNFTNMSLTWLPVAGISENKSAELQFTCTPNPVNDLASISYVLKNSADVTITLQDLTGRNIMVVDDGNRQAGQHTLNWNIPDLKSGLYYLHINTGSANATQKIVITK